MEKVWKELYNTIAETLKDAEEGGGCGEMVAVYYSMIRMWL